MDENERDPQKSASESPTEEQDTEGHGLLLDPSMARQLDRARSADIDRAARDRRREKEARPNRSRG